MRKLGDTITFDFMTHNPSTGMVQDADLIPTCKVFEDDNDSPILAPTVVKRVDETGDYRVSIEATISNGFGIGRTYNVIVSVTVNSIIAKSRIGIFDLDSKRNADMNDLSQGQILSDVTPFQGARIDESISSRSTLTDSQVWVYTTRELTSFDSTGEIGLSQEEHDELMSIKDHLDSGTMVLLEKSNSMSDDIKRLLGLVHENIFIDLPIYDKYKNLISSRIRIYSNPESVGTEYNTIATYLVTANCSEAGKFNSWKQISIDGGGTSAPFVAGEDIDAFRIVMVLNDKVYYASSDDVDHMNNVIGISTGTALMNESITIKTGGVLENSLWFFDYTKPIFLGTSGYLSQIEADTGVSLIIGFPLSSTKMFIDIKVPIVL